jgi:hypothetical protein
LIRDLEAESLLDGAFCGRLRPFQLSLGRAGRQLSTVTLAERMTPAQRVTSARRKVSAVS